MRPANSSRKMKLMAGVAALAATLFTAGGTLALAETYARTAANGQVSVAAAGAPQQTLAGTTAARAG